VPGRLNTLPGDLFGVNAIPADQPLSFGADGLRSLRLTHQAASLNDNACQRFR
jgi:hypothetical protein